MQSVHFLHIGKTGGNALKAAIRPVSGEFGLVLHNHKTRLHDVPEGARAVFFVRDPAARFVSAFNSRLRMGRPLKNAPWNEAEKRAFDIFRTPTELAEAISSPDGVLASKAADAMHGIRHVNAPLGRWLDSVAYLAQRRNSILHVGHQETLSGDFEAIKVKLGLPGALILSDDPLVAHHTPDSFVTHLSPLARRNLACWYRADYEIMRYLDALRAA